MIDFIEIYDNYNLNDCTNLDQYLFFIANECSNITKKSNHHISRLWTQFFTPHSATAY